MKEARAKEARKDRGDVWRKALEKDRDPLCWTFRLVMLVAVPKAKAA